MQRLTFTQQEHLLFLQPALINLSIFFTFNFIQKKKKK